MGCSICGDLCNRVIGGYSLCNAHATPMVAQLVNGASPDRAYKEAVLSHLRESGHM